MKTYKIYSTLVIAAVTASSLFTSCGNKWKEPALVTYNMKLAEDNNTIRFTSASVRLKKVEFIGERKQGQNNINFEKEFEPLAVADITEAQLYGPSLSLNIPQGTYSKIQMNVFIDGKESVDPSLVLRGYHIKLSDTIPVIFKFYSGETLEMHARTNDGGKEIILSEDMPASASIRFNPSYWFETISSSMLDHAALSFYEGDSAIVFSQTENIDMYKLVIDRLKNGSEVVFNQ